MSGVHMSRVHMSGVHMSRVHMSRVHMSRVLICHVFICHVFICHVLICHVFICHVFICHVFICHVFMCHVFMCHVFVSKYVFKTKYTYIFSKLDSLQYGLVIPSPPPTHTHTYTHRHNLYFHTKPGYLFSSCTRTGYGRDCERKGPTNATEVSPEKRLPTWEASAGPRHKSLSYQHR